jgi:hypothetical protein
MRWYRHLMELLIFNFFFLEHVWPGPQNWWIQRRPFLRLGDGDARVCNSLGYDFSHLNFIFNALHGYWNFGFLPQFALLTSLAWLSTKQVQDLQIILQTNAFITTFYDKVSCD